MCNSRRKENPNALQSNEVLYFDASNASILYVNHGQTPIDGVFFPINKASIQGASRSKNNTTPTNK